MKREIVTIGIPLVVIGGFVLAVWGFNALVFYFVLVLAMITSALALLDWLRLKRGCVITRDKVIDFALLVVFLILALCVTVWFLQLNLEYQVWRTRFPMAIEPWQTNLPRYLLWIPMILLWGLVCKWASRVF